MSPRILGSLRARLLLLFALLAIGPLTIVGVLDYLRWKRLVEELIRAQTDTVAKRAAKTVADHYATVASDILLFTENAEVQRLFRELSIGDSSAIHESGAGAGRYLKEVWDQAASSYYSAELKGSDGTTLWHAPSGSTTAIVFASLDTIAEPVRDLETGRAVGSLTLVPRPEALWSREGLGPSFGRTGYTTLIDRGANRVLLQPSSSSLPRAPSELMGVHWSADSLLIGAPAGSVEYGEGDSIRLASFVSLAVPPWTILSSTAVSEFSGSLADARRTDLTFLVLLIAAVAAVFIVFVTRATRSLEQLTRAAVDVGRGELSPALPPAGHDEVGTLAGAFADMADRVRSMMREIEVSRQLAVLGEFAAQLSHEVRNPLTSLKLDLQGMQRQVRGGDLPISLAAAVDSSLREVGRLDSVVNGVLTLANHPIVVRQPYSIAVALGNAVTSLRSDLERRRIDVRCDAIDCLPGMVGDPDLVTGMFINLLVNASDAQPAGGRIGVTGALVDDREGRRWARVTIADDGPGVTPDKRADIFRPFFTMRHGGTGLGLSIALRTAREHGGRIACEDAPGFRGAAFVVSLPVAAS